MEKVVEEILLIEKAAESILGEARQKAMQIQTSADAEVQESVARAKADAAELVKARLREAKEQAAQLREKASAEAEENNRRLLEQNEAKIDRVVEEIIGLLIKPLYNKG